jgi:hypothetical protein
MFKLGLFIFGALAQFVLGYLFVDRFIKQHSGSDFFMIIWCIFFLAFNIVMIIDYGRKIKAT